MDVMVKGKEKRIQYVLKDLLVRGYDGFVRYLVIKGKKPIILMATNLNLSAADMLRVYSARFQVEFCIRDMKQHLGFTQYQVRRSEAVRRFLNIAILVYSLLKIAFFTSENLQSAVARRLETPWRTSLPVFSLEQLLEVMRQEIFIQRFFNTSAQKPKKEKIPTKQKSTWQNLILKC